MRISLISLILLVSFQTIAFSEDTIFWDTIHFEAPYEFLEIDSSAECIWQEASPQKEFFSSAYAGKKAILTDSSSAYPIDNHSFFELKIGEFNFGNSYPYNICLEIKHKFDTDTLLDGAYITLSFDNGKTWYNIFDQDYYFWDVVPGHFYYYYPDTLINGERGFSGNSGDWISSRFEHYLLPVKSLQEDTEDTLLLRFNFVSDDIDNAKEGWMIDEIILYSPPLGSGSIESAGSENYFRLFPNPSEGHFQVELFSFYHEIKADLFTINGKLIQTSTYFNSDYLELNYRDVGKGIYFLKLTLDGDLEVSHRVSFK